MPNHGTGSEQELLITVVNSMQHSMTEAPLINTNSLGGSLITADAGYHSEANLKQLATMQIDALIADNGMRQRDERFAGQAKYKTADDPLHDKSEKKAHANKASKHYQPQDFNYNPETGTCLCPAGKSLYQNGSNCIHNGYRAIKFQGALRDCVPCEQRNRCLRRPDKTKARQVSFFQGKADPSQPSYSDLMKQRIDSEAGRAALCYGRTGVW